MLNSAAAASVCLDVCTYEKAEEGLGIEFWNDEYLSTYI